MFYLFMGETCFPCSLGSEVCSTLLPLYGKRDVFYLFVGKGDVFYLFMGKGPVHGKGRRVLPGHGEGLSVFSVPGDPPHRLNSREISLAVEPVAWGTVITGRGPRPMAEGIVWGTVITGRGPRPMTERISYSHNENDLCVLSRVAPSHTENDL